MFKRKVKEPAVYLEPAHVMAIGQALAKLNTIQANHDVTIRGVLRYDQAVVGSVFYNSPGESYVIEWNR